MGFQHDKRVIIILVLVVASLMMSHSYFNRVNGKSQNDEFSFVEAYNDMTIEEQQQTPAPTTNIKLRFNWTNLDLHSPVAKRMKAFQTNCSLPLGMGSHRPDMAGLGSDLHVWGQTLANSIDSSRPARLRYVLPWIWLDEEACGSSLSAMECYFAGAELQCPKDREIAREFTSIRGVYSVGDTVLAIGLGPGRARIDSPRMIGEFGKRPIRAGTIEFLFHRTTPLVVREAERQLQLVFGSGNQHIPSHNGTRTYISKRFSRVPEDLITVHIRWGDKSAKMELVPIMPYIDAVKTIEARRIEKVGKEEEEEEQALKEVNIFLATEDPKAIDQFMTYSLPHWNVFVDQYYFDALPYRKGDGYNGNSNVAAELKGRTGLIAIASILVALEANDFVLTTDSNWSRMMNALRIHVVEPRCGGNCTSMIDLRGGWQW